MTYEDIGNFIKRTDENGIIAWIPKDDNNSDYQQYLIYLNPGSVPSPHPIDDLDNQG